MLKHAPSSAWFRSALPVLVAWFSLSAGACGLYSLPPLEEQKARILSDQITLRALTAQAFLEAWGEPTYSHSEPMQFFPVASGNYIPRFRVPLGESPPGWDDSIVSEHALFLGYADRGELLGFLEKRLIYREHLPAEQIHAIAAQWKREELFKTRLEAPPARPPSP